MPAAQSGLQCAGRSI